MGTVIHMGGRKTNIQYVIRNSSEPLWSWMAAQSIHESHGDSSETVSCLSYANIHK